jgi:hypothetical protein
MLGKLIFESRGRITGQRVLSVENEIPKFEISITGTGIFTGSLEVTESWTYRNYFTITITGEILRNNFPQ